MRVIISGGGTGGHIFPAIAIGQALQRLQPDTELLFVGAKGKMEMEKIPQAGYEIVGLDIVGFNRSNLLSNISLPFKLLKSRWQADKIIENFKPNVVVGVGGFASFPIMNAAQAKKIPTVIQEQNAFAGKSNKILGTKAKAVCVAYEGMEQFFPANKIHLLGNPVRASIAQADIAKQESKQKMCLDPKLKTLLVIGGSLGAKSINEAIAENIEAIMSLSNIQLLWQTGKLFIEQANSIQEKYKGRIITTPFINEMEYAYAAADIVISRAGALAIAELCIVGKPVIFVPYPYAAEDHQSNNAMALVKKNAAWMVKDEEAKAKLPSELIRLITDNEQQKELGKNIKSLALLRADERIAEKIIQIVGAK